MWGSAFAVCITQSSLTCQFEHSGKVRSGLIGNFYFHCYQVRPHFLCAALMSSQRTKQHAVRRLSNIIIISLRPAQAAGSVYGANKFGDACVNNYDFRSTSHYAERGLRAAIVLQYPLSSCQAFACDIYRHILTVTATGARRCL